MEMVELAIVSSGRMKIIIIVIIIITIIIIIFSSCVHLPDQYSVGRTVWDR